MPRGNERDTIPTDLRRAYGPYGKARSSEEAWRSTPSLEGPTNPADRYPIRARLERRRARWRTLNGWLQMLLLALVIAVAACSGFVAGALYEMRHAVIRC